MRWLKVDFGIRSVRPAAVNPPAVNDLHKVEKDIQIQHASPHRPMARTLSCDFGDFSADRPAANSLSDRRSDHGCTPRRPNGTASISAVNNAWRRHDNP